VNAITALGKPTIAVVAMGRPQGLAPVIDKLPAVLTAYYGGPHQGTAIADALFGVTNPGGKLPITIPRHSGQVPIHHGQKNGSGYRRTKADIHRGYLDMPSTPLFPFGHGLSYTTFEYSPLKLASNSLDVARAACVAHDQEYRKTTWYRDRPVVRSGYRDGRDAAGAAAHWLRARGPRAWWIEDDLVCRAAERPRLHRRIGRTGHGTRPDRSERG
jgi:hypothetical protein